VAFLKNMIQKNFTLAMKHYLVVLNDVLIFGVGFVHFYLWQFASYKFIPIIGVLFLLNWVASIVLIVFVSILRRLFLTPIIFSFALATLLFYVLSLTLPKGIFLFKEISITGAGYTAIICEGLLIIINALGQLQAILKR
jgi:hypothetical protein